jgi:hypothetical protein
MSEYTVILRRPHAQQAAFIESPAKRKAVRAGRRGGKTVGVALLAVKSLLARRRVLYAVPTQEQIDRFWSECKRSLQPLIDGGVLYKNETRHILEFPGTEARIRAKTAWNADSLRGDYADLLILDEWQLMNEDAWEIVGAPMMLDTNGDAVFVYTPPSFRTAGQTKAHDPRHASKLFERARRDTTGRWAAFHFGSTENPYLSQEALAEIVGDMSQLTYRQEILAQDIDEAPGALWTRKGIEAMRLVKAPDLSRVVVGVDPSATRSGDEAGIISGGVGLCDCRGTPELHGFVLADDSVQAAPEYWAKSSVTAYHRHHADAIVAEANNGGEMVRVTIQTVPHAPPVKLVYASRGKYTRAEPISLLPIHVVGSFPRLEDELCQWIPGMDSPNRLDAFVWTFTELMVSGAQMQQAMDYYARRAAALKEAAHA